MAFLAPLLPAIGTAAAVGGTVLSTVGAIRQGQEAKVAAEVQADQQERAADEQRAQASREVAARLQEQKRILGDQAAVASASGGMATDPSVLDLAGEVGGYGYEQRQGIIANGENVARGYQDAARYSRMTGKSALQAGYVGAAGSLLSGLSKAGMNYAEYMGVKDKLAAR